jgi:hypothetical protein
MQWYAGSPQFQRRKRYSSEMEIGVQGFVRRPSALALGVVVAI